MPPYLPIFFYICRLLVKAQSMMEYNKLNNVLGWSTFLVAAWTFLSTIEPTVSFWDCGEYIATAYKLEVGHPPGGPFFQMLGRLVTLFTPKEQAALMING